MEAAHFTTCFPDCAVRDDLNNLDHDKAQSKEFITLDSLNEIEKLLITLRSKVQLNVDSKICLYHKHFYLHKYTFQQKKCCDPFKRHKRPSRGKV